MFADAVELETQPRIAMNMPSFAASGVAILGGLAANIPEPSVANTGVWVGIGGLVTAAATAFYPWFRDWLAHQQVAGQLARLNAEFHASQERNHKRYNTANALLLQSQDDLRQAQIKIAFLQGQAGVSAIAISANSTNIAAISKRTDPPTDLPVPVSAPSVPTPSPPDAAELTSDSFMIPNPLRSPTKP